MARPSPKSISAVRATKRKLVHGDHEAHMPGDENVFTAGQGRSADPNPDTIIGPGVEAAASTVFGEQKGSGDRREKGGNKPTKKGTNVSHAPHHPHVHHITHHVPAHMKPKGKEHPRHGHR